MVSTASYTLYSPKNDTNSGRFLFYLAGVPGLEPGPKVLETSMLTVDTIPLCRFRIADFGPVDPHIPIPTGLFTFSVRRVTTTATAEFFELKPVRRALFVLSRHVVALFALRAL